MSDYLWDKSGERDAEVERLEELLGEFRHRPRALELPPDVEMNAARAPRSFGKAWLAVAAALLLALMAVAFVALRSDVPSSNGQPASQAPQSAPPQLAPPQNPTPQLTASPVEKPAPQSEILYVNVAPSQKQVPRHRGARAGALKPEQGLIPIARNDAKEREGVAIRTLNGGGQGEAAAESAARQQLAKEQLVYALRLTSSKLKEVRRKTQGIVDSKSDFDERNRIR